MKYTESRDAALGYAKEALKAIDDRGLVPNPNSFAVWYAYVAENIPELKKHLDDLIAKKGELDDTDMGEIYEMFLGIEGHRDELKATSDRIERLLGQVMKSVDSANKGATHYEETLESFSGNINENTSAVDLKTMIGSVMKETKAMAVFNKKLETQLSSSSNEITKLKQDLANVQREATTDGLTGIANRKLFDATLAAEAEKASTNGTFLCLLMTDIDHFKNFNDTHGHQLGDQVLRLVAHTLTQSIRGQDTAARYGGEEFCVILPGTQLREAAAVAENVRKNVASKKIINRSKGIDLGKVTLSIGVSEYSLGEDVASFIKRADDALYAGKKGGRNRVVTQNETDSINQGIG